MIAATIAIVIAALLCIVGAGAFVYDLFKGNLEIHERR